MNLFLFDFNQHQDLVDSFLLSASLAHNEKIKARDWFYWKFRDNPFGESILACISENGNIIGCVALGLQDFVYEGNKIKGAISFETFIHPNFQGKGIFKKLIDLAENEASKRNIQFLLNFPNSNSLKGFIKSGWKNIDCSEYWLKGNNYFNIFFKIKDIKKPFIPNSTNITEIAKHKDSKYAFFDDKTSFKTLINKEYLDWRFFLYPNAEYKIIDNEEIFSIARVGYRGRLKEIQVLLIEPKNEKKYKLSKIVREYKKQSKYDLISFPISKNNKIRRELKKLFFIKVPSQTNVTYKMLDSNSHYNFNQLELSAINYHTY